MAAILVIDDDLLLLELVADVLRQNGHDVHSASSGIEALEILDNSRFDLVITDIFMPDLDGLEIIGTVRKKVPGLPVMVMSGAEVQESEADFLEMARKLGAVRSLRKPFDSKALLESIQGLLVHG